MDVSIDTSDRHSNHIVRLVHDLSRAGWTATHFPTDRKLEKNHQLIELQTPHRSIRVRVSVYKIGGRGEAHRLHQQRIEITTTLRSGLPRLRNWSNVVLGYENDRDAYVGLDPRRLSLGGETHNASTSIDPDALASASNSRILIRPHETRSLGLEYQAVFRPQRLGEYLFNYEEIHRGVYRGDGLLSGPVRRLTGRRVISVPASSCRGRQLGISYSSPPVAKQRPIRRGLVEAFELEDVGKLKDLPPDELERIRRKCQEVGDAGESFVYERERKRLQKVGRDDLAKKIDWVSQKAVGKGYDIKSFEVDGAARFIEVKSTIGESATFFMSGYEWKVAGKLRNSYWIYRVVLAMEKPRLSTALRNPVSAERHKGILRVADGWRITILK